jgi:acetoin utilization deacetylase AcuC-like enzyme
MKAFWNPVQLAHAPQFFLLRGQPRPNFEIPARAEALLQGCRSFGLDIVEAPPAALAAMLSVHAADYLDFLTNGHARWAAQPDAGPEIVGSSHPSPEMIRNGARRPEGMAGLAGWYTSDAACPIGKESWAAIEAAAGCALAAAEEAAAGRSAYALARPPGHHAYPARAGGHCYVNNAALAAERLRTRGAGRVAILDIDSHHGNGTQGIFWERGDVLFVSVHGDPDGYYPWFTGRAGERGEGAGAGLNLNLPLALGTGDAGWLEAVTQGVNAARNFGAEALVVSLGFDASKDEPLNALSVSADGFSRAGEAIGGLRLPTTIVQEGGYNVDVLGGLLERFLGGFSAY